jgi:hypothetical protein
MGDVPPGADILVCRSSASTGVERAVVGFVGALSQPDDGEVPSADFAGAGVVDVEVDGREGGSVRGGDLDDVLGCAFARDDPLAVDR